MTRGQARASTAELLHAVGEYSVDYVREARSERTRAVASRGQLRSGFARTLPRAGLEPMAVLDELLEWGEPGLLHSGAPTFLGFVMGGAYPVAVATGAHRPLL